MRQTIFLLTQHAAVVWSLTAIDVTKYSICTHREIFSESVWSKPNFDCNYIFPTDLAPNGIPFVVKLIEKV